MWAGYLATVTFMDEQVGRILKTLKKLGLDKDTAVFFTSDHGYLLGEHHFWQKGNLREEVTRVPLIMKVPGQKPAKNSSMVELVDMFPTACELTGLPIPKSVQGTSLLPILENPKASVKKTAFSFAGGGISMRTPNWSYMRYKDGSEELYDMKKDPKQFKNLAKISAFKTELQTQRRLYEKRNKAL
jgi:iduronate 2-sulfatase